MKVETNIIFTHISANIGIKKFGEKAVASMVEEY